MISYTTRIIISIAGWFYTVAITGTIIEDGLLCTEEIGLPVQDGIAIAMWFQGASGCIPKKPCWLQLFHTKKCNKNMRLYHAGLTMASCFWLYRYQQANSAATAPFVIVIQFHN